MVALWRLVVGGLAIALGIGWVLAPTRMSRLQTRVLYFGFVDSDYEQSEGEELAGRIAGVVLAALGAALIAGVKP